MPDPLKILLDQNIPFEVAAWLKSKKPNWEIRHVKDVDLSGKPDASIFQWAQSEKFVILTFDEDFADRRSFPVGDHYGVIRLRVWPTTIEETEKALTRLFSEFSEEDIRCSLVIIGRSQIRLRRKNS